MKAKKFSGKKVLKAVWIIFALVSVIIWIPKVDRLITADYEAVSEYVSLDDAWDITINEDVYTDVSLTDLRFPAVRKGDRLTLQRTLASDWNLKEGALRFYVRHSAVRMFIDGEMVYEYGVDRMAANKTVGSGMLFVPFPNEYQGKLLSIQLTVAEDKAFTSFDSIRLYEWANVYRVLATESRLPLFCGGFLTIFGLIVCVITIFALVYSLKYVRLFCISLFSICMGLWTLSYYNVLSVFSMPLYSISLINYLTLYLAPIPLTVYICQEVYSLKSRLLKIIYWIFLCTEVTASGIMITLHTFDIVHMAATLKYMQVILVGGVVLFFIVLVMSLKFSRLANRLSIIGMLIIISCVAYDMIGYNSVRYYGSSMFRLKGVLSSGIMLFICMLFISFYIEMTQKIVEKKERDFLIKSAYTDELTQLHNRRYCMEYMNKIKEAKEFKYTVVCFDLNNLKTMNDTYGHAKGDILIKSAADVIAQTFEKMGIVARMGGDEFIAVLETSEKEEIESLMKQFSANLMKKNQDIKDLNMSIACGYASGNQAESDIEKIFQKADDRMYENKKKMKSAMKSSGLHTIS